MINLDIHALGKSNVLGGKAANLARLIHRFSVPEAFILLADEPLVPNEILKHFDKLGAKKVAVRSSGANEDGVESAWAGQLETKLNVDRDQLVDAVKICRSSAGSERAKAYASLMQSNAGGIAILIQRMINARVSGVAFTRNPVTGINETVIEAVIGLGDNLVSGLTNPDTYSVPNDSVGEYIEGNIQQILSAREVQEVAHLALGAEQILGFPVDIEWAYEDKKLYLLQARPITTL